MRISKLAKILGGLALLPLAYVSLEIIDLKQSYKYASFEHIKPTTFICVGSYIQRKSEVFYVKKCDADGDNKTDITSVYKTKSKEGLFVSLDYPFIYMIDQNKNGKIEESEGEIIIDYEMDGLNGNEIIINEPDKHVRKYNI